MQQHTLETLLEGYRATYAAIPQDALELDLRITIKTIQAIAKGSPVSPAQLANIWDMPLEQVQVILEQAQAGGQVETNDQGDVVGAVLSLNPTNHQVRMGNKSLYAWCAYDAIYSPCVVGIPAQIVSLDPISGERIRVSISPSGVEKVEPKSTVVSIISAQEDMRGGPYSPRCTNMLFFGSRQSAEQWKKNKTGVAVLTLAEAFELVKEFQIEPAKRLGLV